MRKEFGMYTLIFSVCLYKPFSSFFCLKSFQQLPLLNCVWSCGLASSAMEVLLKVFNYCIPLSLQRKT